MQSLLITTEELESAEVHFTNRSPGTWILREEEGGRVRFATTGPDVLLTGEWTEWLDPSNAPFYFYLKDEPPKGD